MATTDDYVLAMANEENLSRIELKNVAIFFTSLDGKPIKIGRLGNPVTERTTERTSERTTERTTEQHKPSGDSEEGTRVHLSFEEHLAIDARLSLSLDHVYKPAPSDRQKENGIDPDQISQRRTLHLGKLNLEETPMYRKVILSAENSGEDNEDESSAGDPTDDEDYFSAVDPTDDEAKADMTPTSEPPLITNVEPTTAPSLRNLLRGIANKFLTFFTTPPSKISVEQDMPPEQPAEPTKSTEQPAEPTKSTEQPAKPTTSTEQITDDDYLVRIKEQKSYAGRNTSANIKMPDTGVYKSFLDKLVREEPYNLGEQPEKPGPGSSRRKAEAERPKPKAEQPWRVVADPVDRMLPPVPFEEIADQIDMNKDMLTALLATREVWEVFLRFTPEGDYMTNWVTSQHDYGSQTEVVAATREIIKTSFTLRLYIAPVAGFEVIMDNWIAAFVDHCRSNALYKWIVPKKRFYVQMGQTMPQKSLLPKEGCSCPARMSFKE